MNRLVQYLFDHEGACDYGYNEYIDMTDDELWQQVLFVHLDWFLTQTCIYHRMDDKWHRDIMEQVWNEDAERVDDYLEGDPDTFMQNLRQKCPTLRSFIETMGSVGEEWLTLLEDNNVGND